MSTNGSSNKVLLIIFGVVLILITSLGGYYLYKRSKLGQSIQNNLNSTVALTSGKQAVQQQLDLMHKQIADMQTEIKKEKDTMKDQCTTYEINPMTAGLQNRTPIDSLTTEYNYTGKLVKVEKALQNHSGINCSYTVITLEPSIRGGVQFKMTLPSGITYDTGAGIVSPLIYRDQVGKKIGFMLRLKASSSQKNVYTLLEWQPTALYLN